MTLLACGINHHLAPLGVRETLAIQPEQAKITLQGLMKSGAVNEAMILSTCNRVEIYSKIENQSLLNDWLAQHLKFDTTSPYWYFHQEGRAVSHIMRVASGLDSMILGESEILKQMRDAYRLATEVGSLGQNLQRLLQTTFNVAKHVRTDTQIGANPLTLGYCAVTLAKRIFSDLTKRTVLLIGAGDVIELTALHLYHQGIKRVIVANRSIANAEKLARRFFGHWISMSDIPLYLQEADIVVSATASDLPILGKGAVEAAIKARKHKPIFMLDLAVPRDVESQVGTLEDVYLYNIDDLRSIIDENRSYRESAAQQAEAIIALQAQHYMRELQALDANTLICDLRTKLMALNDQELLKAINKLNQGFDSIQVLKQFSHNLINKILHSPCTQMRQAAFDGRLELLALAKQLLDL